MVNVAFDGCLQQLLKGEKSYDQIVPTLIKLKNYYVQKIASK